MNNEQLTMKNEKFTTNHTNNTNLPFDVEARVRVRTEGTSSIGSWLIILLFLFSTHFMFAENEFSFKVGSGMDAPIGIEEFSSGIGAGASLDWTFFNFYKKFDLGVTAQGAFSNLGVATGDPLLLFGGSGGVMLKYRMLDRLAFRTSANAGAYQYAREGVSATNPLLSFSLGAEYHISQYFSLFADGNYTYRTFSSKPLNTIGIAAGLRMNLSEIMGGRARMKIDKTQQYRVFPVSWAWYEYNPVAAINVTNEEQTEIKNVNLSFFIDSFMSEPWTFANIPSIASGETVEVPVTALFNESLINLSQNVIGNGTLQVQYRSLGSRKETSADIQMPIFQRNTLSWDDDRRAAAFVSPFDYSVMLFARNVAAAVENLPRGNTPQNVIYAAALFEALRLYRINYIVDPSTSYTELSLDASALDSLNYPYETLYYRGGECDDLSILYCSLLEALGIEAAFITVPGHIYTAFEVGDDNWLFGNADIIELNGKRWIPMEATVTSRGFSQGWQIGMRQWRTAGNRAELFPIRDCWTIYPSVTVPFSGNAPQMPDLTQLPGAVTNQIANYRWENWQVAQAAAELERRNTVLTAQRVELAAQINTVLEEQNIQNTVAEATSQGIMIRLSNIQFLADSAQLTSSEIEKINEIAAILKTLPGRKIQVTGHTAFTGNREGEQRLSQQRARTVANLLIEQEAVTPNNIISIGQGSDFPIADNSTAEGMAANRRVEITIRE